MIPCAVSIILATHCCFIILIIHIAIYVILLGSVDASTNEPSEDVATQILVRLPPNPICVLTVSAVCKSWMIYMGPLPNPIFGWNSTRQLCSLYVHGDPPKSVGKSLWRKFNIGKICKEKKPCIFIWTKWALEISTQRFSRISIFGPKKNGGKNPLLLVYKITIPFLRYQRRQSQ